MIFTLPCKMSSPPLTDSFWLWDPPMHVSSVHDLLDQGAPSGAAKLADSESARRWQHLPKQRQIVDFNVESEELSRTGGLQCLGRFRQPLRCSWLIGCFRCFQVAIENHIGDLRRLGRFGSLKYVTSTNLLLGPFGPRSRKTSCPESQTRSLRWDSQTALPMYNAARSIILWPATIIYYWGTQKCWCTGYTFTFKHVNPSKFDLSL